MDRATKKQFVADMNQELQGATTLVLAHYKGLTVAQISDLRGKMRAAGANFKVTKNRLTQLALNDTKFTGLKDLFTGPTAIGYSTDAVAAAKVLVDFAKTNDKLIVLGGAYGDRALKVQEVEQLAKMPSLDELRGKLVGLIQAPAQRIASVLQAPAAQVARVIGAHARKE